MEMQTTTPTVIPTPVKAARKAPKRIEKADAPKTTNERTPLKKVCGPLKIDPKTARRVLRKQSLAFHDLGNRWDLTDHQVQRVKEVLRAYLSA